MGIPDLDTVRGKIQDWGIKNPRIIRAYLYGSFLTKKKSSPGDIDIAIEISSQKNDTASGFWCGEGKKMEEELSILLAYKVDLEWLNDRSHIVKKGLADGSLLIYEAG
ncbi:MAG: hypothetical protein KGJ09_03565 [Candidatus Omnitrophica bacterium]|nr:hypothetical protein [Candidatus Omnitrophota bacterium]